jgi:hypothetical protein
MVCGHINEMPLSYKRTMEMCTVQRPENVVLIREVTVYKWVGWRLMEVNNDNEHECCEEKLKHDETNKPWP